MPLARLRIAGRATLRGLFRDGDVGFGDAYRDGRLGVEGDVGRAWWRSTASRPVARWVERRVFPGSYAPSLKEIIERFESSAVSVLDVENLSVQYVRTLGCWRAAFEQARESLAPACDSRFVRTWRLYLAGACASVQVRDLQLFQVLVAPRGGNDAVWIRESLGRA